MKTQVILLLFSFFIFSRPSFVDSFVALSLNSVATHVDEPKRCSTIICFGLEGSELLQEAKFNLQKELVYDIVLELTKISYLQLSAVQYGITNTAISPLTYNVTKFLQALTRASLVSSNKTALGSPIVYCDAQLDDESSPKIIVLLGRGKNAIGGDPVTRAKLFRESGGVILAVSVGDNDEDALTEIVGGNPSQVIAYEGDKNSVIKQIIPLLC